MSGKKRAFTLVEILVSILILGIVMSAVLTIFYSVFESYQFHQDINEAKQRGQIALAALQPYVINAGLGLPNEINTFQEKAFNGQNKIIPVPGNFADPKNFRLPVQLAKSKTEIETDNTKTEAPALWLVYSVPSGAGINSFTEAGELILDVGNFSALDATNNLKTDLSDLRSWLAFPASMSPFTVETIDVLNKQINIDETVSRKLSLFDEIHFIRAVKIYVNNNSLWVESLLTGQSQSLIEGIAGMWVSYDHGGDKVLKISVLARGDTRHNKQYQTEYEGWPADAPLPPTADRTFRYAVVSRSWRIRN